MVGCGWLWLVADIAGDDIPAFGRNAGIKDQKTCSDYEI